LESRLFGMENGTIITLGVLDLRLVECGEKKVSVYANYTRV
jgi:hypothetical protein